MTARSVKNLQQTAVLYPIAVIVVWTPAVLLGFWGLAQFPELANPDFILPTMVSEFLPIWVVGFALAGILAALMSSLDGQVLTLSTFFTEDVLREFFDIGEYREIYYTRGFLVVIFLAAFIGAMVTRDSIVDTATFAFSGYGLMFFPICSAFYWRRSNKYAAYAGLLWGFLGIWAFELGLLPSSLTFGFLPFVPLVVTQLLVMIVVAYATEQPPKDKVQQYEELFEHIW
jgi:SSS family solute:Na+ symporter